MTKKPTVFHRRRFEYCSTLLSSSNSSILECRRLLDSSSAFNRLYNWLACDVMVSSASYDCEDNSNERSVSIDRCAQVTLDIYFSRKAQKTWASTQTKQNETHGKLQHTRSNYTRSKHGQMTPDQWRSEARCCPGSGDYKCAARSTPQTCLQEFSMKDHVSCSLKISGIIKHLEHHYQTLTNWNGSCFSLSIVRHAFSACRHVYHHYCCCFFCFLYKCIYGPGLFYNFSSLLAFSLRKATPFGFNRLLQVFLTCWPRKNFLRVTPGIIEKLSTFCKLNLLAKT